LLSEILNSGVDIVDTIPGIFILLFSLDDIETFQYIDDIIDPSSFYSEFIADHIKLYFLVIHGDEFMDEP